MQIYPIRTKSQNVLRRNCTESENVSYVYRATPFCPCGRDSDSCPFRSGFAIKEGTYETGKVVCGCLQPLMTAADHIPIFTHDTQYYILPF